MDIKKTMFEKIETNIIGAIKDTHNLTRLVIDSCGGAIRLFNVEDEMYTVLDGDSIILRELYHDLFDDQTRYMAAYSLVGDKGVIRTCPIDKLGDDIIKKAIKLSVGIYLDLLVDDVIRAHVVKTTKLMDMVTKHYTQREVAHCGDDYDFQNYIEECRSNPYNYDDDDDDDRDRIVE